jgi:hypothetical protein
MTFCEYRACALNGDLHIAKPALDACPDTLAHARMRRSACGREPAFATAMGACVCHDPLWLLCASRWRCPARAKVRCYITRP